MGGDDAHTVEDKFSKRDSNHICTVHNVFAGTITQLFPDSDFLQGIGGLFSTESLVYWTIYGLMIIFFTFLHCDCDGSELDSDNMKKHGGFIPGIRPGPL